MTKKVAIYWDFENVRIPNKISCLIDFAHSKGDVVTKKVYSHWPCEKSESKLRLEHSGFDIIDVQEKGKNSVDLRLKSDCIAELKSNSPPDFVILLSGDHGFSDLVNQIKAVGKQVIVIGQKGVTSHKLQRHANEFHYANDLCELSV